ncbi:MAG: GGDEF domain-containing protein [Alphaproteobacteria bacterium]|nr:MAG: GGDEF domain-containing protein [Alphaproteobacteria bacterium]
MVDWKLPRSGWGRVWQRTAVVIGISSLLSLAVSEAIMLVLSRGMDLAGAVASMVLPIVLGGPAMFYMQLRSAQLAEANRKLEALAATDWLTDCLNRRAFTTRVDAALGNGSAERNALLVIDADHFKTINDRFGHHRGDEVLQLIAEAIRASVREGDLVGRLGGEEFGVFLHGANDIIAMHVGERIRKSINALFVRSDDIVQRLSVSIGGVTFEGAVGFAELFRVADTRLYEAKRLGRNQILMADSGELPRSASA